MDSDYRVLIVDDNENVLHLLKYALEERGMHVDCTTSLTDAVQLGGHHAYDAVVVHNVRARQMLERAGCTAPMLLLEQGKANVDQIVSTIKATLEYVVV